LVGQSHLHTPAPTPNNHTLSRTERGDGRREESGLATSHGGSNSRGVVLPVGWGGGGVGNNAPKDGGNGALGRLQTVRRNAGHGDGGTKRLREPPHAARQCGKHSHRDRHAPGKRGAGAGAGAGAAARPAYHFSGQVVSCGGGPVTRRKTSLQNAEVVCSVYEHRTRTAACMRQRLRSSGAPDGCRRQADAGGRLVVHSDVAQRRRAALLLRIASANQSSGKRED
jgi:hypothetical protein